MLSFKPIQKHTDSLLIIIILLAGILLRFYRFDQIPFTHDEFSAIFRTDFSSLKDLINEGVKPDGHPAGIQVFLYFWTQWFGTSEFIVKLPFLILGTLSIYFAYLTGSKMFGKTTGLITAAYISTLEYTLMYSQIARPYISGMFFGLLLVWFWYSYIQNPYRMKWLPLTGFVVSAVLCMYNHYFSALFVILVGFSGFFFLKRKALRNYLFTGFVIALLFLPHLKITLSQLQNGGLSGWLGKPGYDFIIEFIKYIFHFSWILFLITLFIAKKGFKRPPEQPMKRKLTWVVLSWFILSFLIGFIYSRSFSPVLQYSVLIFSFPFLLMGLFSRVQINSKLSKTALVFSILIINLTTLITLRKYFPLFYQSPYYEIFSEIEKFEKENNKGESYTALIEMQDNILMYQLERSGVRHKNRIVSFTEIQNQDLSDYLRSHKNENFLYGSTTGDHPENYTILSDFFPVLKKVKNYCGGNFYHFSSVPGDSYKDTIFHYLNNFEDLQKDGSKFYSDSLVFNGKHAFHFTTGEEYGPAFSELFKNVIQKKNNVLDIKVKAKTGKNFKDALLVFSIESGGEIREWKGEKFSKYQHLTDEWFTVYLSINAADISKSIPENAVIKIYVWNREKQDFLIDNLDISSREGNPVYYGLWRNIY